MWCWSLLSLFVVAAVVPARADGWLSTEAGDRPTFTGSVEALLLWRNSLPSQPLYFDSTDPASVPLDTAGVGTGMAAGPRYRIDWNRFDDGGLEFNYFNVQSFNGSRTVSSPGGQLEQSNILGFNFPDVTAATAVASAGIKSFELNRRRQLGMFDGDFLYGFRWVEWTDGLRISDTTVTGAQTGADAFLTNTTSSLYGAQLGLDLVLLGSRRDRAWIEGVGKAGVYYDNAVQNSFVDSVSVSQITRNNAASAETTSFMGELGFTGCLRLSDHWVARTGFTMFWLGNVAAAADQLAVNDLYSQEIVSRIDTGANVFLYGLNLGLEASW
ncbi:MAG: hypothetical protein ACKO1M_06015 [Planctomycetota bacterium]